MFSVDFLDTWRPIQRTILNGEDLVMGHDQSIPGAGLAAKVHHLVDLGLELLGALGVIEVVDDDGAVGELQDGQAVLGLLVAKPAAKQIDHRLDSVLHHLSNVDRHVMLVRYFASVKLLRNLMTEYREKNCHTQLHMKTRI